MGLDKLKPGNSTKHLFYVRSSVATKNDDGTFTVDDEGAGVSITFAKMPTCDRSAFGRVMLDFLQSVERQFYPEPNVSDEP